MTNQCEHGSLARSCPLCEANAEIAALRTDINSEFNACMFRDHCRSMESEIAALRAEVERLRNKIDELNSELNRWEWGEYGL